MPTARKYEVFVAEYRNYRLTVLGRDKEWEYSISEGKWNLVQQVKIQGSRQVAQQAAAGHLVSFLSKTEQSRYKGDDLRWRDWTQETATFVAKTRDWLAGRRSENS